MNRKEREGGEGEKEKARQRETERDRDRQRETERDKDLSHRTRGERERERESTEKEVGGGGDRQRQRPVSQNQNRVSRSHDVTSLLRKIALFSWGSFPKKNLTIYTGLFSKEKHDRDLSHRTREESCAAMTTADLRTCVMWHDCYVCKHVSRVTVLI